MSFLRNIFGKEEPLRSYEDFWVWFQKNEREFYSVVKRKTNYEQEFFDKVSPKLSEIKDGLYLLAGMYDENTAEVIITPDGSIKNIVFAEEIVAVAPGMPGWKFTALKPEATEPFVLRKDDIEVGIDNLQFYANEFWHRPDDIDISVTHDQLTDQNRDAITHAVYLFLDNYLGELSFATTIDNLNVVAKTETEKQSNPITELKGYLTRRMGSFVEKYEGTRLDTDEDSYTLMEAHLQSGAPLIAVINTELLKWDRKPSHPWIAGIQFGYNDYDNNGLPGDETYQSLGKIEDEIEADLRDYDGYLNVGRETAKNVRTVYFACKDFRKPSKVFDSIKTKFSGRFEIDFDVYKDKYWQSFDRFLPTEDPGSAS